MFSVDYQLITFQASYVDATDWLERKVLVDDARLKSVMKWALRGDEVGQEGSTCLGGKDLCGSCYLVRIEGFYRVISWFE